MFDQPVCIFAHFKEIRFFLCGYAGTSAVRTFAVHQLRFCKEGFTGSTVHSFIMSLVNISFGIHFFEDFLYLFFVICISGTNKFIIGSIHEIPDPFDLTGYIIYKFLRRNSCFRSLQLNLLSMLIGSCLEENIITLLSLISGNGICQNNFVSITDMRLAGSISNGSGNIIFLLFHVPISPLTHHSRISSRKSGHF